MSPEGWGPSHQTRRKRTDRSRVVSGVIVVLTVIGMVSTGVTLSDLPFVLLGVAGIILIVGRGVTLVAPSRKTPPIEPADPLALVQHRAATAGGTVYLGVTDDGAWRYARSERAVLLLGPPRSGKTSTVIIPALLSHQGPAVSTSTKPEVAAATSAARSRDGRVWVFDPTGTTTPKGGEVLRWSPIRSSQSWDGALLMARAMTAGIGAGITDRSHWAKRAQALLAPFLHAAAIDGRNMEVVVDWVMRHKLDEAGIILENDRASRLAFGSLLGLLNTEDRERSSVFSATADALDGYTSETALTAAADPNFDAAQFVASGGTVYIHAPAEEQAAAAPIVCGLLAEIRRATYQAHANGTLTSGRMLFALDEVANIAPLEELPQIAAEGGGQGLTLIAALQDLSQARGRWGTAADGFLTLFGTKVLLPGIADTKTLDAVSVMLGEYDRKVISRTSDGAPFLLSDTKRNAQTVSTQRTRVLSPGEIAGIPARHLLHLDGTSWKLLTATPAHATAPWQTLTSSTSTASASAGR